MFDRLLDWVIPRNNKRPAIRERHEAALEEARVTKAINTQPVLGRTRVRVGIASENEKKMKDTGKFVLGKFGILERKDVAEVIKKAVEKIKDELKI